MSSRGKRPCCPSLVWQLSWCSPSFSAASTSLSPDSGGERMAVYPPYTIVQTRPPVQLSFRPAAPSLRGVYKRVRECERETETETERETNSSLSVLSGTSLHYYGDPVGMLSLSTLPLWEGHMSLIPRERGSLSLSPMAPLSLTTSINLQNHRHLWCTFSVLVL